MRRWIVLPLLALCACGAPEESPSRDASAPADELAVELDSAAPLDDAQTATDASAMDSATDSARDAALDARVLDARVTDARVTDAGAMDSAGGGDSGVPLPRAVTSGASCHALLDRIGIRYTIPAPLMGVVDPVRVSFPINGVNFRYASYTAAVNPLTMDCRLAVAIYHLTRELRTRWDVTDLVHLGVYNYRPIAGTMTLSQHSYATALDISNLRTSNGTTHSVLNDFVANGRPTCPPRASNARDLLLKQVACWMNESRVFHIVLTPNYNAAHRDHFHVDLTAGSNFIASELPAMIDPEPNPLFELWLDDH
jgi:hypothetical protein